MMVLETKGEWVRMSTKMTTPSGELVILSWWQKSAAPVVMKDFNMEQLPKGHKP